MDKDKLARMASSMRKVGMLKPLLVVAVGDHFQLVAGERRHKAAHDADLKRVPITVRPDGDRELMTATENSHHEDLDPVAQARTWQMVAEAHGLKTYKQIAEAVDDTTDAVGKHLRVLKLPERVQGYFEEGIVPLDGERHLRDVARISPRVAECICEVARREKVKPSRFVGNFEALLLKVPETKFDNPPTMIPVWGTVGQLVTAPDVKAKPPPGWPISGVRVRAAPTVSSSPRRRSTRLVRRRSSSSTGATGTRQRSGSSATPPSPTTWSSARSVGSKPRSPQTASGGRSWPKSPRRRPKASTLRPTRWSRRSRGRRRSRN
jgi:ParB/RepB/Spo0J family partition protein